MTCATCGATAAADQRFCGQCGTPLVVVCSQCGTENPPGHRFCGSCGSALGTGEAPRPEPEIATERRVVSVLFVDLVGFTSFSEGRDPEDVRALITEYFDVAKEVVDHFGGTVDKFIGDAVMAWWGARTSNEDDAERAVRSALEIVDRVRALGERLGIPDLAARAGVMTGEASVGPGGNEKGLLLGDLVNSASRVQSLAEPGTVLVGDTTGSLVRTAIELVGAGTHVVKGKEEPITVFAATRVLSERGGAGRADVLEPPFVGRDPELRLIKEALHAAGRDRRARLVSLVGQGGIGKSRLIWEFLKYVDGIAETVYWHEGRSPSYGDGLSLWALAEMIRQRADVTETDDEATTADRLDAMLDDFLGDDDRRGWVRERLGALLGLGDTIGRERTELFAAARALFEAISRRGTAVLVFEDLQWADAGMLEFIEELPDWSQDHPILVITAARPDLLERRPDWGSGRRGFASVYISPLTDAEMALLIEGAVPGIPAEAVASITAAAGGVPLFAVETLRMLLGDGRLSMQGGTATIEGDLTALEVPSSVQAVIAARLDRLPPEEREVARDAAVLGHSFTLAGLTALRDEDADKVERRLAGLVRHEILELIRDSRSPERGQYQWVQGLLREVAYGRIARTDRFELHLRAARYFQGLDDPELAPVAAAHYLSAREVAPQGVDIDVETHEAIAAAIDRARTLHAHEQVIELADRALQVVDGEQAVPLWDAAILAASRASDDAAVERLTSAFLEYAAGVDDPAVLHRAMAAAAAAYNTVYRADRVIAIVGPHVEAHPDLADDPDLTRAAVELARSYMLTGDWESEGKAGRLADAALGAAEKLTLLDAVASAMISIGTSIAHDRPRQGVALIKGGIDICERHGYIDTKLRGLINLGYASIDVEEGRHASEQAFTEAKRVGDRGHATFVAGNLIGAYDYFMMYDELEEVLFDPVLADTQTDRAGRAASLAGLLYARGDASGAREALEGARAALQDVSDAQTALNVERSEATISVMEGDPGTTFATGVRHFEETPFAPHISAALAVDGAIHLGDEASLRRALAYEESLPSSPFTEPARTRATIVLMLLDGDVDGAVEIADRSLARLSEDRMRTDELYLCAALVRHLPPGPLRDGYADRGRSLCEASGAPGLAAWIDRLSAG